MTDLRLVVVIPARNEAVRIDAALRAMRHAERELHVMRPDAVVTVVVAADRCRDETALLARQHGVHVVEVDAGSVGAARSAAVGRALELDSNVTWIASTDADSVVPPNWLRVHADHAISGCEVLLGSIRLDPRESSNRLLHDWQQLNPPLERHQRVYGANLGIAVDAYSAVGGFSDAVTDEDVGLVERCRGLSLHIDSTDRMPVSTSARLHGRAPGGLNGYLRHLDGVA